MFSHGVLIAISQKVNKEYYRQLFDCIFLVDCSTRLVILTLEELSAALSRAKRANLFPTRRSPTDMLREHPSPKNISIFF